MPLDPNIREILDIIASVGAPPHFEQEPQEARELMARARTVLAGAEVSLHRVEELAIPGPAGDIPARVYAASGNPGLPVLVFFHGGGWVLGNLDTHDTPCRLLAEASGCLVVSIDYRLAPEHKFPAAVEDALAALDWIGENAKALGGNPMRLSVGGDSAGGNLAAVLTQHARDNGGPSLSAQLLIYPSTDRNFGLPSAKQYAEGYLLTLTGMRWFWDHYLNHPGEADDPRASPVWAESLAGLPPALVVIAEHDVLRDDGLAYATRLSEAGVPTRVAHYNDVPHGFFTLTVTPRARKIIGEMGAWLMETL